MVRHGLDIELCCIVFYWRYMWKLVRKFLKIYIVNCESKDMVKNL